MLEAGTIVGGYRIEHLVGKGGMGAVYAGVDPTIGKRVAIKILKAALSSDEATRARFEREARAVNAVRHPAVIDVFAFGHLDDGRPYFVMSFLEGCSLRESLDHEGRFSAREAWRVLREVAEALAVAHDAGVIHRDLKPDNVFLEAFPGRASRPRILDFGIAKVVDLARDDLVAEQRAELTGTGTPIGTPTYMSPEQWWSQPITPKTDQYCFGVTLHELIAGKPPFASQSYGELLEMHLHAVPPSLAASGIAVASAIESFLARLLGKSPDARFDSFRSVIAEGDRAFGVEASDNEPAHGRRPSRAPFRQAGAPLVLASTAAPPVPRGPLGVFRVVAAGVLVIGCASVWGVGYAGEGRRDLIEWVRSSGYAVLPAFPLFAFCLFWLFRSGRRRSIGVTPSHGSFFLALVPLASMAIATYSGWVIVLRVAGRADGLSQSFRMLSQGMVETSTPRFMGFALASMAFLVVAALFGVTPRATSTTSIDVSRRETRWSAATAALLGAATVSMAWLHAPSAALVFGAGTLAELVAFALPTVHSASAHRDARDRAVAMVAAILFAGGVATSRVEAREAVLWKEAPTRSARITEIVAAAREHDLSLIALGLTLATVIFVEVLRERRLRGREKPASIPRSAYALAAALVVAMSLDFGFHRLFFAERARLLTSLHEEFSLFAKLDPPSSDDPLLHEPRSAPALDLTEETIAIAGRGVAKLSAIGAVSVRTSVEHDLTNAIASREGSAVDLLVLVDRRVGWARARDLLSIACSAGARKVDVLFTRGASPTLPDGAPAEAGELLPQDFGALEVELDARGLDPSADSTFSAVAADLLSAARRGESPVVLSACSADGK